MQSGTSFQGSRVPLELANNFAVKLRLTQRRCVFFIIIIIILLFATLHDHVISGANGNYTDKIIKIYANFQSFVGLIYGTFFNAGNKGGF